MQIERQRFIDQHLSRDHDQGFDYSLELQKGPAFRR
jgi:hypothetical protein